ncbi:MAG: hypothetical protein IT534_10055 [Bauldia sp.]|nr:hypothetical protein [Bauldia sp.]
MRKVQRAATALALAVAGVALAACETTTEVAPAEGRGVAVQLSETQFEMVKATVRESLWEPTGAYFTPNVGAVRIGNSIAVCGILNGSNPYNNVNDAVYVVYLHLDGGLRGELVGIGGPSRDNRELSTFCLDEFGITLGE